MLPCAHCGEHGAHYCSAQDQFGCFSGPVYHGLCWAKEANGSDSVSLRGTGGIRPPKANPVLRMRLQAGKVAQRVPQQVPRLHTPSAHGVHAKRSVR
jgi:hypothetical protein